MTKALVIVHAEQSYADVDADNKRGIRETFDRIAGEIPRFLMQGDPVYFFGQKARTADSPCVYEKIRTFAKDIAFIHTESDVGQEYLRVKEQLISDSIDKIVLAGVSRLQCVAEVYDLLSGENRAPQRVKLETYQKGAQELGRDEERFERIYKARLNVCVDYSLTAI